MAYRVVYSIVEVAEWGRGIVTSLHSELIEVDGLLVKSCRSSRLETAEFKTSTLQRIRQAS